MQIRTRTILAFAMVAIVFSVREYMMKQAPIQPQMIRALAFIFLPVFLFENFVPESMNDTLLSVIVGTAFGRLVTDALEAGSNVKAEA